MSDVNQDPDLEEMWLEAERESRKLIGFKDGEQPPKLTVEDVLNKLDEFKTKDETDASTKLGKAKEIYKKTLVCIDSLGSIVAQGASVVFGPSEMCFNAISFLIRTTQNYSKIFAGITLLFERISAFLERFQIYTATVSMDKRLKRLIHQLLQSFMRICILSLKLTRSHRVLLYTKVFLFNTDEGVQEEMDKLECLVRDEVNMSVALILQSAKVTEATVTVGFIEMQSKLQNVDEKMGGKLDGVASQVRDLHAIVERSEKESKVKQNAETNKKAVQKALDIQDDKESWAADVKKSMATLIDGTGDWLVQGNAEFVSWAKAESNAKPAFAVEGREGFGKSHLFSAVFHHLTGLHALQSLDRRVSIAYFSMGADGQVKQDAKDSNGTAEKSGDSLDVALKSIIWQLTNQDIGYQKSVATACKNCEQLGDIEQVWNRLVIDLSTFDATFFVLLDGIERIDSEHGQRLLRIMRRTMNANNKLQRLRIQWFVTGTPSSFSFGGSTGLEESPLVSKITLGTCNKGDIIRFINSKMNSMTALSTQSKNPEIDQLRATICERLSAGVSGDFTKLDYKLRDISTKTRKDEIEEALTHVTEDIGVIITRQIKRLSDELDELDIEDLNELLVWIVAVGPTSPFTVTIAFLDEVLSLRTTSRSLVPLRVRIETNFAPLLEMIPDPYDDNFLVTIAPSFLEHFFQPSSKLENATSSGSSSVLHPSEIAIVERFLKNICDDDLYERFEFEGYFRQKSAKKKATVYVDIESVHVKLVTTLLTALCCEPKARCPLLMKYLIQNLGYHLSEEKWASASQESKRSVGSLLVKLFSEEEVINRVWGDNMDMDGEWDPQKIEWVRSYWIIEDNAVRSVLAWFKDPATNFGISEKRRAWINNLTSNAKQQADLMKEVVLTLAKAWLRDPNWLRLGNFMVVCSFHTKIEHRKADIVGTDIPLNLEPDAEKINNIEAWFQHELPLEPKDAKWERHMSGIFREYRFGTAALQRVRSALDLDPEDWLARFGLANTYALEGPDQDLNSAVEELSLVAARFRSDPALMKKELNTFSEILDLLGKWNTDLKQYNPAREIYNELLDKFPHRNQTILDILQLLRMQEKTSEINDYLRDLNTEIGEDGLSKLVRLYHNFSDKDHSNLHNFVRSFATETELMAFIRETFLIAIIAATTNIKQQATPMRLRYWYALTLYQVAKCDHDYEEALEMWEQNLSLQVYEAETRLWRYWTVQRIALAYLRRVRILGSNSAVAKDLSKRLKGLSSLLDSEERNSIEIATTRCCSFIGDTDEAKQRLRKDVRDALSLLSNEDPTDDWQGYMALAPALMRINDDDNALAAWALMCPNLEASGLIREIPIDKQRSSIQLGRSICQPFNEGTENPRLDEKEAVKTRAECSSEGSEIQASNSKSVSNLIQTKADTTEAVHELVSADNKDCLTWTCDGVCNRTWLFPHDMYYCRDCIGTLFDEKCYQKLIKGTLEDNHTNCESSHDFLHIPRWDAEAQKKLPPDSVMVRGNVVLVKDWLDGIKKDWGFGTVIS